HLAAERRRWLGVLRRRMRFRVHAEPELGYGSARRFSYRGARGGPFHELPRFPVLGVHLILPGVYKFSRSGMANWPDGRAFNLFGQGGVVKPFGAATVRERGQHSPLPDGRGSERSGALRTDPAKNGIPGSSFAAATI